MNKFKPFNFADINAMEGCYIPSSIKYANNAVYQYWFRSLFQRAVSAIEFDNLPTEWNNQTRDFFRYCLFALGYVGVFDDKKHGGFCFLPCGLKGRNFYYQPTHIILTHKAFGISKMLEIGKDAELIRLTPDYSGIFDIIQYYAEKLASLDTAINVSITNSKIPNILCGKNRAANEALKKVVDKINSGESTVIVDYYLKDMTDSESPFNLLDASSVSSNYITDKLLKDWASILNAFDSEIGIVTLPYEKKERMVTDEATMKENDATARAYTWLTSLNESLDVINKRFSYLLNGPIVARLRTSNISEKEGAEDVNIQDITDRD